MNSSLYSCRVMHHRLAPKTHSFGYRVYLFYLDIEELPMLAKKLSWLSVNRFNLFNFRDKDHLHLPEESADQYQDPGQQRSTDQNKNLRDKLKKYLHQNGLELGAGRVMLLTNLAVLGYNFNPVSFYFCFDEQGAPLCAVAEISNTFREMKLFLIKKEEMEGERFRQRVEKYFYVSPFIDLDTLFDFDLAIPNEKLTIRIDDYDQQGNRFFLSTLMGDRKPLTNTNLLRYFFSIPMIPLQVMTLIHWQAFLLWRKKFSFHKKKANQQLQKDVYKPLKTN
ncbi:DUF1365 domain-containing protein [Pedobacter gandavensis]|uniref:DUF1365 domain-containing protein n=1 Tax=Pedobacter gandavensis TaxID=2679963 RepID=UPI00247A0FA2|nr:DUF1365 domain-containing protein [Pedobacter gandavensis]WGQ12122.1 DUF1365 domain-containing protein [Pedobacter gandavensis]